MYNTPKSESEIYLFFRLAQIKLPKMAVVYGFVATVRYGATLHADASFHVKYAENEDEELKYAMDPYFNDIAVSKAAMSYPKIIKAKRMLFP